MRRYGFLALSIAVSLAAAQQSAPDIPRYVSMVEAGEVDNVKEALHGLSERYPSDPGVLFLQALVTPEGADAVRLYQSIIDNFPKSEWADDALYKVYQFYYALGLYRTAELKLAQLKKEYPTSRFLQQSTGVATDSLNEENAGAQPGVPPVNAPVPPPAVEGSFTLQAGAFSTSQNAEKQKNFFEDLKMPVEVIMRVKDGRTLYIVLAGNFKSADEARARGLDLKKNYSIDSMVITR